MTNVIDITHRLKKSKTSTEDKICINNEWVDKPTCRQEYLDLCKKHLVKDDYEAILMAIMDKDYYFKLAEPYDRIIDCYYSYPF